ncbi:efflux RND transporter periplasmic adaptor subunit [Bradyrhizobium genosp. A]|uniref:efflux RND transporter periplasmic adaptor subunit n=1 Tax=Bradyrhizobium genosp. A TaxID=83626 RepID=UPI003CEFBB4E
MARRFADQLEEILGIARLPLARVRPRFWRRFTTHSSNFLALVRLVGFHLLFIIPVLPCAMAQSGPPAPPVVGVIAVERRAMTESDDFNGRIQAINSVNIVARVTAFLEKKLFVEGSEVKKGDLLYTLERPPFQSAVELQEAVVAQAQAQLDNDNIALWRAKRLVETNAGTQATVDNANAMQRTAAAQLKSGQAQLETAHINLDYTELRSPIDGRIGRTSVTIGNVVNPTTGTLVTVVSQDPMYVVFPVPTRRVLELREQYADKGGFDAVKIRVRLPDGRIYGQIGKLEFVDNTIAPNTDTLLLRGIIPNPVLGSETAGGVRLRELVADEFVTVLLESVQPRQVIAVPRSAIMADQQGTYLYVADEHNVARQRRVHLGQSTPEMAAVVDGLTVGERIIVEGIQRVRPNSPVEPASPGASKS